MVQVLPSKGQAVLLYEQGCTYADKQQWMKALQLYEQALKGTMTPKEQAGKEELTPREKANIYAAIAQVKFTRRDNERDLEAALTNYSKALSLYRSAVSLKDMAQTHYALANVLVEYSPNLKEAAIAHYQQAIGLFQWDGNQTTLAEIWQRLGDLQKDLQDWNTSLHSYQQASHYAEQARDVVLQAQLSQCIGDVELKRGNELVALDAYTSVEQLSTEYLQQLQVQQPSLLGLGTHSLDLQITLAKVFQKIGRIKQDHRQWNDAEHYFSLAAAMNRESGDEAALAEVGRALDEIEITSKEGWRYSLRSPDSPCQNVELADQFMACLKRGDLIGAAYVSEKSGKYLKNAQVDSALIVEAFHDARWYYGHVADKHGMAYASGLIATSETDQGNLATALEDYAKARWYYGEVSDIAGQAYASLQIASIEMQQNNLEAAQSDFAQASHFYTACLDQRGLAYTWQKRGELENSRQHYSQAVTAYAEALKHYQAISDERGTDEKGVAYLFQTLGDVELTCEHWSNSLEYYQNAQALCQKHQNSWGMAYIDSALGKVHGEIGKIQHYRHAEDQAQQEWTTALQKYEQALTFYELRKHQGEKKVLPDIAAIYLGIGEIQKDQRKLGAALKNYQQAADLYENLKDYSSLIHVFAALIDILQIRNGPDDLERALRYSRRQADLIQIANDPKRAEVLQDIETNFPLCAITLRESETNQQIYVGKTYTIRAGVTPQERTDQANTKLQDPTIALCDELAPLYIDIKLYTSKGVTCQEEPHQQLLYNRKNKATQLRDFAFQATLPGYHTVAVDFYYKQRWLKTISFEYVAVKPPQPALLKAPPSQKEPVRRTPLPLAGSDPTNIALRIHSPQDQDDYTVDVSVGDYHLDEQIDLLSSSTSIVALNTLLHRTITAFVEAWRQYTPEDTQSKITLDNARRLLVIAGRYAYTSLFSETLRDFMSQNLPEKSIIQIIADQDFALPWELLYDGPLYTIDPDTLISQPFDMDTSIPQLLNVDTVPLDLDTLNTLGLDTIDLNSIDANCFWGMHYHIIRKPSIPIGPIPSTTLPERPRVGLIVNTDLPAVSEKEYPALLALRDKAKIYLVTLRDLDPQAHQEEITYLITEFLQKRELDIIHLASHSERSSDRDHYSTLVIAKNFPLEYQDLDLSEPIMRENHPLLILNACKTGQWIDSRISYTWPQLFWKLGARGVVATEFVIPDDFAADFITKFYEFFLTPDTTISDALLKTRQHFNKEQHTILGLAYALYAPYTIKIQKDSFAGDQSLFTSSRHRLRSDQPLRESLGSLGLPHAYGIEEARWLSLEDTVRLEESTLTLSELRQGIKLETIYYCPQSKQLVSLEKKGTFWPVHRCPLHHKPLRKIRKGNFSVLDGDNQGLDSLLYCDTEPHLLLASKTALQRNGELCPEHKSPLQVLLRKRPE